MLIFANYLSNAQSAFTISYHLKLYREDSKELSRKDRIKNKICIAPYVGTIEKFKYTPRTKDFFVKIHTTQPVFTIIWKQGDQLMRIAINHATGYKEIYLDSIAFKPFDYYISGDLREHMRSEDETSQHLSLNNISTYKQANASELDKIDEGDKKCW